MVWPLSFGFLGCLVSINCCYSSRTVLFLLLFLPFSVMGGEDYRGGGVEERLQGVSFSSVSSPYERRSIEKQQHNVLLWVREEEGSSPALSVFGLASSQSGSRDRGAPFAFHLLRLFFPSSPSQSGWREVGGTELFLCRRTETCWGPSRQQLCHPSGSGVVCLTQDSQHIGIIPLHHFCWVQFMQSYLCVDASATSGPSMRGRCV